MEETIRTKLQKLISENGIKQTYIARYLNLSRSAVCRFLKDDLDLSRPNIIKLQTLLTKYESLL